MTTLIRRLLLGIALPIAAGNATLGATLAAPDAEQAPPRGFAAIAYSQTAGRWGAAWNYATLAEAEAAARSRCGAADCQVGVWAQNAYCALAVGDGWHVGRAWNGSATAARDGALRECGRLTSGIRLVALVPPAPGIATSPAPPAPRRDLFAAIAHSDSTGRCGAAWNYSTRAEAEMRAIGACGAPDARIVTWSQNGSCSLAAGEQGRWSAMWGPTGAAAQRSAMSECGKQTTGCRIVLTAPPTATPPPPPEVVHRDPLVKVLLVGLTDDPSLGSLVEVSMRRLRIELRDIPGIRDQDFIELRGRQVTAANILRTVDQINVRPNETLLVYYIGHGAYDPSRARPGDASGGHFFQIPGGDLMRKDLLDHARRRGARLTVLISDTCNVRAIAQPSHAAVMAKTYTGGNPVLRDLLLGHTGVVDVSGSSRNQYGWFWTNEGGVFTTAFVWTCDPAEFRGIDFVGWDRFLAKLSNATSREYQRKKDIAMKAGNIRPEMRDQPDQRPQAFTLDVRRAGVGVNLPERNRTYFVYRNKENQIGTFQQTAPAGWLEVWPNGTRVSFRETARTNEYIEIFDADRNLEVRMFDTQLLFRAPARQGEWFLLWNGSWQQRPAP